MFEEKTLNQVTNKPLDQILSVATTQPTLSMENIPQNLELSTDKVILRPLSIKHLDAFYQAGSYPEIWRWSLPDKCTSIETTKSWIEYSVEMTKNGQHFAFAIFDKETDEFVGSTRFCTMKSEDRNLEIGFTFITPKHQRSFINTHAKYCLLKFAFEALNVIRVEFKTHEKNDKSRNAIARLGASFEGILRNQRILSDGTFRSTAIFSIISSEWEGVKEALEERMTQTYI
ncbi:MAG: RimJ/RimL family protein N-acetyltransferase [Colwellia sp.]|jgi:RimJ/RimL family protein N-acetyltransferase